MIFGSIDYQRSSPEETSNHSPQFYLRVVLGKPIGQFDGAQRSPANELRASAKSPFRTGI
jgi:hypothetical protein